MCANTAILPSSSPKFFNLVPPPPSGHFTATHPSPAIVAKSAKTAAGRRHGFKFNRSVSCRNKEIGVTHSVSYVIPDSVVVVVMMMMMIMIYSKSTRRLNSMVSV